METLESIALSRMASMQRQMDLLASNIANVNTPGYKGESVLFTEYLDETGSQELSYVQDYGTLRDVTIGGLDLTDNPLDLAINGTGYFVISTPEGERYTRNGHFRLDEQGQLATTDGYPVLSAGGGPITIRNASDVQVSKEGAITSGGASAGSIGIVGFDDEQLLEKTSHGLYYTDQAPIPLETAGMVQGALERSNVEPITQVTHMIEILRGFQAAQRLIVDQHEAQRRAIQTITSTNA